MNVKISPALIKLQSKFLEFERDTISPQITLNTYKIVATGWKTEEFCDYLHFFSYNLWFPARSRNVMQILFF
jgi:hypothetical protein